MLCISHYVQLVCSIVFCWHSSSLVHSKELDLFSFAHFTLFFIDGKSRNCDKYYTMQHSGDEYIQHLYIFITRVENTVTTHTD